MSKDLCLHHSNSKSIFSILEKLTESGKRYRLSIKLWIDKRSIDQNSLSHMWYADISKYYHKKGQSWKNEKWVKNNIKQTFLGHEKQQYINLVTGEITENYVLRKTSELDIGEMHFYLNQVEAWCSEVGIPLRIPDNSQYWELKQKQVE